MSYSVPRGRFPRVTHPSATIPEGIVRLACVKHAASVRSEPGSNSQVHPGNQTDRNPSGHPNKSRPSHIELTSPARPKPNRKHHFQDTTDSQPQTGRRPRIPSQEYSLVNQRSLKVSPRLSPRPPGRLAGPAPWRGRGYRRLVPACQTVYCRFFPILPLRPENRPYRRTESRCGAGACCLPPLIGWTGTGAESVAASPHTLLDLLRGSPCFIRIAR